MRKSKTRRTYLEELDLYDDSLSKDELAISKEIGFRSTELYDVSFAMAELLYERLRALHDYYDIDSACSSAVVTIEDASKSVTEWVDDMVEISRELVLWGHGHKDAKIEVRDVNHYSDTLWQIWYEVHGYLWV